jgi:hypothetical protein
MRVRDQLGTLFEDVDFAAVFPVRGDPGLSPGDARCGVGDAVR